MNVFGYEARKVSLAHGRAWKKNDFPIWVCPGKMRIKPTNMGKKEGNQTEVQPTKMAQISVGLIATDWDHLVILFVGQLRTCRSNRGQITFTSQMVWARHQISK